MVRMVTNQVYRGGIHLNECDDNVVSDISVDTGVVTRNGD